MNYADYNDILKKGAPEGCYLFFGEEDYLKRHCLTKTRDAVLDGVGDVFNHVVLDGSESGFSADDIAASALALPVFAERKLIEVHGMPLTKLSESNTEKLCDALDTATECGYNTLIIYTEPDEFDAGTEKAPSKLLKTLDGHLSAVAFPKESPQRLKMWAQKHFHSEKIMADAELCALIIEISGRDMYALTGEINKLCAYIHAEGRDKLLRSDIDSVCSKNAEIGAFDFANAMLDGNTARAYSILRTMKQNREEPIIILAAISKVYTTLCVVKSLAVSGASQREVSSRAKIHEYQAGLYMRIASRCSEKMLARAVELCYETDIKLKSLPADGYMLIDRLVGLLGSLRMGE